ncbi:MAG: FKBP-type peptidyl-prolyl cis-trans isomerase [Candidatus Nealsonbacteria bacterium]
MNKIIIIVALIVIASILYFSSRNKPQEQDIVNTGLESNVFEIQEMKVQVLKEGSGEEVKNNEVATVHYTGWLEDGTKFDSSVDKNVPFSFTIGTGYVIKGWDLGVFGMKVGEKRKLTIPSELGYGEGGAGSVIPAGAALIFEIELLSIKRY